MGGDEGCALVVRSFQRGDDSLVDGDVALETEREGVCGQIRILVIVREGESGVSARSSAT